MNNSIDLIAKYSISEEDLYMLGLLEEKKIQAGFVEKDKLKKQSELILKPYDIKFIEYGELISQIKQGAYHNNREMIDKYAGINLEATLVEKAKYVLLKYKISEKDLYTLGVIENKKEDASFFAKEKLKAKSMGILKPYNIAFMDIGGVLKAIRSNHYHANPLLIEKYGPADLEATSSSMGLKYIFPFLVGVGIVAFLFMIINDSPSKCDCVNAYESYTIEGKNVSKWFDCIKSYKSEINEYLNDSGTTLMPNNSGSLAGAWESGAYDYFKSTCN